MAEIEQDARLAELTAEMAWLRSLARALLRTDEAADLAQDTWLAAKDHVPSDGRPLRPWLSRIARNLAITKFRSSQRRAVREQGIASLVEPVASPDALVQRVEMQKLIATEVLLLAEPYRSTVLLHFFEELTSAEIARRLQLPEGTVRRRLKVALVELRARLDKKTQSSGAGWAALASLAGVRTVGVVAMKKLVIAVLVLLVVLASAVLWRERHRAAASSHRPSAVNPTSQRGARAASDSVSGGIPAWMSGATARRVAGHVMVANAPLAGARVKLGFGIGDEPSAMLVATVTTGGDGSFDFGSQPGRRFSVSAEAPGYVARSVTVEAGNPTADPSQLVLRLGECHAHLSGTVTDSSGAGIGNALIATAGFSGTQADEHGNYELCAPSGIVAVRVAAPGYGTLAASVHVYGDLRRDFALAPEAIIAGVVVDRANRAIAGALVSAFSEELHETSETSRAADSQGRFQFDGLAPGKYHLIAAADGLGLDEPVAVLSTPAHPARDIRIVVTDRARVTGRVVLEGAPVHGARIRAETADGDESEAAFSAADGRFVLTDVPHGQVTFSVWPYAVETPKKLTVDSFVVDGVTLELSALGKLHGRVTRHGQPVPDAQVRCSTANPKATTTTVDGAYSFDGLPPGPCRLAAQELDVSKAFSPAQFVEMKAGEDRRLDLELAGSAEARGVVVDEDGQPVGGVDVTLRLIDGRDSCEALTQSNGTFDCVAMRGGGDYQVAVDAAPGQGPQFSLVGRAAFPIVHLADGNAVATGLRIAITNRRASIRGRVVDDHGAALADVAIRAVGQHSDLTLVRTILTDATGAFAIDGLVPGTYRLHARAPDGAEVEQDSVSAPANEVELRFAALGSIEGDVQGFNVPPMIWAFATIGSNTTSVAPSVDGNHFKFVGLAPARYVVKASSADESAEGVVVVDAGGTAHVALVAQSRGRIEGTITMLATKTAIAGMKCNAGAFRTGAAQAFELSPSQGTTATDGTFSLPAPGGAAILWCTSSDPQLSAAGAVVNVSVAATTHVELVAVRAVPPLGDPGFDLAPVQFSAIVRSVAPAGPAAKADLQLGDQLVAVDDTAVAGLAPSGAMNLVRNHPPGTSATLTVVRGGNSRTLTIVLGP